MTTTTTPVNQAPVYPMPAPPRDPRFTFDLINDIGKTLAAHGYPPVCTGADLARLHETLFGFLYLPTPAAPGATPRSEDNR